MSEPAQPVSDIGLQPCGYRCGSIVMQPLCIGIDVAQEEEDSEAFRSEEDEHERELLLAGAL